MFGRRSMKAVTSMVALCLLVLLSTLVGIAQGEQADWYPSKWGAGDQRGAANLMTPEKALRAAELMTAGQVYQLGRAYEPSMPLFGTRHYSLRILQAGGPLGSNDVTWHEESFSGEIGQVGTQFDGLGHVGIGDLYYNGHDRHEFAKPDGLTALGVERAGAFVTRGVLIDVAGYRNTTQLPDDYEITPRDLVGALDAQNTAIEPGDVVLLHTGWGALWNVENARYAGSEPGLGVAAGELLVDRDVVLVGADTWAVEVVPNPDASLAFPVHQLFLAKHGVYILENIVTEELARDEAYEFAFIFAPLKLAGGTGSPGSPLAIR